MRWTDPLTPVTLRDREQTRGEELANALSHAAAAAAGALASPVLIARHARIAPSQAVAAAIFCTCLVTLFGVSAAYHAAASGPAKCLLRRADHAAIFVFIAGSYTPFMVGALADAGGLWLLAAVWSTAALGAFAKLADKLRHPHLSTGLYLATGWLALLVIGPLMRKVPAAGLALIFAGAAAYTVGAVVFHFDYKVRYGHLAWHLLVVTGAACHFVAVLEFST